MLADLHIHTNNSDGKNSLNDIKKYLLAKNSKKRLLISITDHHYLTLKRPIVIAQTLIVPGIEISCELEGFPCHLLGYSLKPKVTQKLTNLLNIVNSGYQKRADKIYRKLVNKGYRMPSFSNLRNKELPGPIHLYDLAEALGKAINIKDAVEVKRWAKEHGNLLFTREERYLPSVKETIRALKDSNFIVIWAHPGRRINIETEKSYFLKYLNKLIKLGLDGVEIFHPDHSEQDIKKLLEILKGYLLEITGGSDYHGKTRGPDNPIFTLNNHMSNLFLKSLKH